MKKKKLSRLWFKAGADGFIQELPQGLNTMVGEGGCRPFRRDNVNALLWPED